MANLSRFGTTPRLQPLTFKDAILDGIRRSDLASVGHSLELPTCLPWFLLVPRDLGSAMIVWIVDKGGLLLCGA